MTRRFLAVRFSCLRDGGNRPKLKNKKNSHVAIQLPICCRCYMVIANSSSLRPQFNPRFNSSCLSRKKFYSASSRLNSSRCSATLGYFRNSSSNSKPSNSSSNSIVCIKKSLCGCGRCNSSGSCTHSSKGLNNRCISCSNSSFRSSRPRSSQSSRCIGGRGIVSWPPVVKLVFALAVDRILNTLKPGVLKFSVDSKCRCCTRFDLSHREQPGDVNP